MDNLKDLSPTLWIIILFITNLSSIIVGILSWVKSAKLMPKEIKGADIDLKIKELSLAEQYELAAEKAADKTLKTQDRLDTLENNYSLLQGVIAEQALLIKSQTERIDEQDIKIKEQEKEIASLNCELKKVKAYNRALIKQMKKENIIPISIQDITEDDYQNGNGNSEK